MDVVGSSMVGVGAAIGGSTAAGIFLFTLVVRTALVPVMLPMAVRTRERQRVVRRIKPQIKKIHADYRDDPSGMSREIKRVHAEAGIEVVDWWGLAVALIQLPVLIALFQAAIEISDGSALSLGGLVTGATGSALAVLGAKLSGQSDGAPWVLWLSGVLPLAIALWLGTGVGLYLAAFYAGALVQAFFMRPQRNAEAASS